MATTHWIRRSLMVGTLIASTGCEYEWTPEGHTLNASFDQWCDDIPCDWLLEAGTVEPVPTWHQRDLAAALSGEPAALSQLLIREVDQGATCIRLEVLVDVERDARAWMEIDYLDDGTVEWEREITGEDYAPQNIRVRLPDRPELFRLRVVKTGSGTASLGLIRGLQDVASCPDTPFEDEVE